MKHWIAAVLKQKCARMHQILFQFFPGDTPAPRHWGFCPQTPGDGREGREGKGQERERGGEGKGKEGEGKERGKFASLPLAGIDAPVSQAMQHSISVLLPVAIRIQEKFFYGIYLFIC